MELIKKEMKQACGCQLQCYSKFKVDEVMFWRLKIHRLTEGEDRMEKVIEIIRVAATDLRKHEKNQLFKIDQKLICRYNYSLVLFSNIIQLYPSLNYYKNEVKNLGLL